jgi:hypothetical protein
VAVGQGRIFPLTKYTAHLRDVSFAGPSVNKLRAAVAQRPGQMIGIQPAAPGRSDRHEEELRRKTALNNPGQMPQPADHVQQAPVWRSASGHSQGGGVSHGRHAVPGRPSAPVLIGVQSLARGCQLSLNSPTGSRQRADDLAEEPPPRVSQRRCQRRPCEKKLCNPKAGRTADLFQRQWFLPAAQPPRNGCDTAARADQVTPCNNSISQAGVSASLAVITGRRCMGNRWNGRRWPPRARRSGRRLP